MTSNPPSVPPEPEPPHVVEPARPPAADPTPRPVEQATTRVPRKAVPFTRTAAVWWALIGGTLILIVLLIFIGQNLDPITIHFLGWHWDVSRGIAFLVSAICGSLITVAIGAARMVQLRRAAKRNVRPR